MRSRLRDNLFVLALVGAAVFVLVLVVGLLMYKPKFAKSDVQIECLDGFEYYIRTFKTYSDMGITMAPRWDQDGKPRRCSVEKERP